MHLGKLARHLRLLGFDTLYRKDYADRQIVERIMREKRIVLTRDRRLLFRRAITHGYWVRSDDPDTQLREVMQRLDLYKQVRPLRLCMDCNGKIEPVAREQVWSDLEPLTRRYYQEFYRCRRCHKVYWEGSHVAHMNDAIRQMVDLE